MALTFLATSAIIYLVAKNKKEKLSGLSNNTSKYSGLMCDFFGIHRKVINPIAKDQMGLVVGNHFGFVDILAVSSTIPSLFVTSKEMRETPFLGTLTEFGGCIYVDRKNRSNIKAELQEIIEALVSGHRVIIYPEATSHNGEEILPFKRTLISAAAHAQVPIIPYVFNFKSVDNEDFALKNRDYVCWYGDQSFLSSAIKMLSLKKIEIEIEFLPFFYPKIEDDRAFVADTVRTEIVKKFRPILEKRNYETA